jgi:hypothetical protein
MSKRRGKGNSGAEGQESTELIAGVGESTVIETPVDVNVEPSTVVEQPGEIETGKSVVVEQQDLLSSVDGISGLNNPPIGAKQVVREILDKRFANVQKLEIENIPEPIEAKEVIEASSPVRDVESKVDQLSILETPVVEQEASIPSTIPSEGKNEGDSKGIEKETPAETQIPQKPVEKPLEKEVDTASAESNGRSTRPTSSINEAILREDSAFTVGQSGKTNLGAMGSVFKKYKNWFIWGSVAAVSIVCLGGLALSAISSDAGKDAGNKETAQSASVNPLSIWSDGYAYGYQQNRGQPASWWIASITPVDNTRFNITWNGDRETGSGKGTGLGSGNGVIHPDGHVEINIGENVLSTGGFSFSLGGQQTQTQLLQLKGRYIQQGSLSYFIGHDMRRGNRFDPETTWVLMRKLPPGWKKPETAP